MAAGAALALPARLPAQVRTGAVRDGMLAEIAKREQQKAGDMLWRTDRVGIADYGLRSSEPRFHFVNLEAGRVDSYLVTHGSGSDPEHDGWLNWFSNVPESMCSCRGAFMTYGWYTGRFGTSIRLEGLEADNSNALDRAIVMHRADYAERAHLERWGKLGRSNGCFAMGEADFKRALLELGGGRVLFADSLGLAPDGSTMVRPQQAMGEIRPLTGDPPRGEQILNPGVY
ncbi:murein L,D-transpeptidase catalytic domain-containing protein [Pelagerythrobacter sp.]|uniref:murein L,D-transpeptidase catalytic domain-containing protein n=1 Tax=Pelagerythrobacter sp. TaxID=2800702 RepID=UPI0035AF92E5